MARRYASFPVMESHAIDGHAIDGYSFDALLIYKCYDTTINYC